MIRKIEAILFSCSEPISAKKLAKVLNISLKDVEKAADDLIKEYSERETAIEIIKLGDKYLMRVKPEFADVVKYWTEKDLDRGTLRTLAIIALKQPIKLSELAKIRGNKCYEHVKKLRELDFIHVEKRGRGSILRTTENFARYFGLKSNDPEEIRKILLGFDKSRSLEEYVG